MVICHPHPLYGGSMSNNVVEAIESGFAARAFSTLKFNFRGVGGSAGEYDEGEGEVGDVVAAVDFLKQHIDGDAGIILAGYSFGAWIAARATARMRDVGTLFIVAYPFAFYGSDELKQFGKRTYLIGGQYDDISPVESLLKVYKEIPMLEKNLKIIPTDHFYGGKAGEIAEFIKESFEP